MTRLQKVMTRAWEIAREAVDNFGGKVKEYFSEALKMAWVEVGKTIFTIEDLMAVGAKRWQKAGYDRLYLNEAGLGLIGLEISRYKSGFVSSAYLQGEKIAHAQGQRIYDVVNKSFIDLKTKTLHWNTSRSEINEIMIELQKKLVLA